MKRFLVLSFIVLIALNCMAARKALVIGNAFYGVNYLASPGNDARLISQTLTELGFEVTEKLDIDYDVFNSELRDFGAKLLPEDEAFFYFGGIALQMEGENYLLPVSFNYKSTNDIRYFSIPLARVIQELSKAKYGMLFLDGGRDNNYVLLTGGQTGLVETAALPPNLIVQFSTAPGQLLASDLLPVSPYAQTLNNQLRSPNQSMNSLCTATSEMIKMLSGETQIPWTAGSLPDFYYINSGIIKDIGAANTGQANMTSGPGLVSDPMLPKSGTNGYPAAVYVGNDAPKLHKPGTFANLVDIISATEIIASEVTDQYSNVHFASWNLLRLNLAMFGAEAYLKSIIARYKPVDDHLPAGSHSVETNITQMGAGAGLQNPDRLRLFATINKYSYDRRVPYWGTESTLRDHYSYNFSFAKRVRSNQQSLLIGADYLYNPTGYPDNLMFNSITLQPFSFDTMDYGFFPRWKARGYLYTTDIASVGHESLHLDGIAPRERPLLFTRTEGVLLGLSFDMEERSRESSSPEDQQYYRFSALIHKNFGPAVGFDFNFDYHDWLNLSSNTHNSATSFRGTMRLTLIDAGPLAMSTAFDYVNHGYLAPDLQSADDPAYRRRQGLNVAAFLVFDLSQRLILTGLGQMEANWSPSESFFKMDTQGFYLGGTLGLRL